MDIRVIVASQRAQHDCVDTDHHESEQCEEHLKPDRLGGGRPAERAKDVVATKLLLGTAALPGLQQVPKRARPLWCRSLIGLPLD